MFLFYLIVSLLFAVSGGAIEKVILPDTDRTYLLEMLETTYGDISVNNAQEIVNELENYYTGIRDNIWKNCGPPYQIDKAFHLHIIPPSDLNERCGDMTNKLRDHGVEIINEYLWKSSNCGEEKESSILYNNTNENKWITEDETRLEYCDL